MWKCRRYFKEVSFFILARDIIVIWIFTDEQGRNKIKSSKGDSIRILDLNFMLSFFVSRTRYFENLESLFNESNFILFENITYNFMSKKEQRVKNAIFFKDR